MMSKTMETLELTKEDLKNLLYFEKLRIELALILTNGNRVESAKTLNMSVRNFQRKLIQYDLK